MKRFIVFAFALIIGIAFVATSFAQEKKEVPVQPATKVETKVTPDKPADKPVKEKKIRKKKIKKTKKAKPPKAEQKPTEAPPAPPAK